MALSINQTHLKKTLSDGRIYKTVIDPDITLFSLKFDDFFELKKVLKILKGIIKCCGVEHRFVKDLEDVIKVFQTRFFGNNLQIPVGVQELSHITHLITNLQDYIETAAMPNVKDNICNFSMKLIQAL